MGRRIGRPGRWLLLGGKTRSADSRMLLENCNRSLTFFFGDGAVVRHASGRHAPELGRADTGLVGGVAGFDRCSCCVGALLLRLW